VRGRLWTSRATVSTQTVATGKPILTSIAVLPFQTIGFEGENSYLGLGMTDAAPDRFHYLGIDTGSVKGINLVR